MKTIAFSLLVLFASVSFGNQPDSIDLANGESRLRESSRGNRLLEVTGPTANLLYGMGQVQPGNMRKKGEWVCYLLTKDDKTAPVCASMLDD